MASHESAMYVYAARYAHHRNTGAALQVVNEILHNWDKLHSHIKDTLKKEALDATYNRNIWIKIIEK